MTLLALETVTPAGSLAMWHDGQLVSQVGDPATPHASRLPLAVVEFLSQQALTLAAVDRLAVVCGPGSFTGVRIGMACVQGLAATRGLQVAAVSTLDALVEGWRASRPDAPPQTVVACLDGMRGEVFAAVYRWDGHRLRAHADAIVTVPGPHVLDLPDGPVVMVGSGAVRYADVWRAAGLRDIQDLCEPLAASAARLAAGPSFPMTSPADLRPIYVRRPDVELARERQASTSRSTVP